MSRPRLFLLLSRAHHAVKQRLEQETKSAVGLTRLELAALWALHSEPGLGVQALARELYVDHAVVSRLSKQLFRKGVARRVADPNDRRRAPIELTDEGEAKAAIGLRMLDRANARIAEGFTDEEIAVVARFLKHLIDLDENQPTHREERNHHE
ncbi:MAG: MarR family transcriptional regulator [Acidobacteriota bacterium]